MGTEILDPLPIVHRVQVLHAQAKVVHTEIATRVRHLVQVPIAQQVVHTEIVTPVHRRDLHLIVRHVQAKAALMEIVIRVHLQIVHAEVILSVAIVLKLAMIVAIVRLRALANAVVGQIVPVAVLPMTAKSVHVAG
jgi:hypothetical protein